MEKTVRLRTNINDNTLLHVGLKQDIAFYEVLSLKINQDKLYKVDDANYGVVVGRVLANDAFGIPNARVSIFLPLTEEDQDNSKILSFYNYKTVTDLNRDNIQYNLLKDNVNKKCDTVNGTFPNKRYLLDNDVLIEVFDKYYKYTTVTNQSGDYMLYNVPTGNTTLHVDLDLSDIGILSQRPRDFIYKGYDENQFDTPMKFKHSTNLNELVQIVNQNQTAFVYPFYGESQDNNVGITRCDINVNYKFEPTCVFMGGSFTDTGTNYIGSTCTCSTNLGRNEKVVAMEGTIEMIRKTDRNYTEEFTIKGNQLIDGDGVWCYQIPMNLDYVGTDEYGNICPTNDSSKGIPTRARVRFRFSLNDNEGMSNHRAKMLVPNNPELADIYNNGTASLVNTNLDEHYNFGSTTLEEDFRDLYWNKVYSVKSFIPRFQKKNAFRTRLYSGLKSANYHGNNNPFPYNNMNIFLTASYKLLCTLLRIIIGIATGVNKTLKAVFNALGA